MLTVIERLKVEDQFDVLELVHFHLGSQMANIRDVRNGVSEAARFYCELRDIGAQLKYLDVGGGLAVDYARQHAAVFKLQRTTACLSTLVTS